MSEEPIDDELSHDELAAGRDPEIGDALRALLGPGADLRTAAAARVNRRLQSRSVVLTIADLSTVGWETIRHLLTNPPTEADGDSDSGTSMSENER